MPSRTLLPVALAVMGAGASLGLAFGDPQFVTGMVAAFPALAVGIILLAGEDLRRPLIARALAVSGITALVVLAVNYDVGGGTEWGGRFLHLLLPLLVPVALVGLARAGRLLTRGERRIAAVSLAVATLMLSMASVRALADQRHDVARVVDSTLSYAGDLGGAGEPPLVLISRLQSGASRYFWQQSDTQDILNAPSLGDLFDALRAADRSDRSELVISTNLGPRAVDLVLEGAAADLGWSIDDVSTDGAGAGTLVTLSRIAP
jgi:hypothetical protein